MPARPPFWSAASLISTWGGAGLLPVAPGTWGSLAALPVGLGIVWLAGPWGLSVAVIVAFVAGLWATSRYLEATGEPDPGAVVIDEVAGQWLALLPVCLDLRFVPIAFVAFRLADILKPWPASWADRRLKGAMGVMADDVAAGVYAGLAAWLLTFWLGYRSHFPGWPVAP